MTTMSAREARIEQTRQFAFSVPVEPSPNGAFRCRLQFYDLSPALVILYRSMRKMGASRRSMTEVLFEVLAVRPTEGYFALKRALPAESHIPMFSRDPNVKYVFAPPSTTTNEGTEQ